MRPGRRRCRSGRVLECAQFAADFHKRLNGLVQVRPRVRRAQLHSDAGLALRHGLTCLNTPGTIDSDYRGEVGVLLINLGQTPAVVARGERIAQMVFARFERVEAREVEELSQSERGAGGFGSTGR